MNFEARYIALGLPADPVAPIVAIWCALSGRMRRFSVDNVRDSQVAGHRFYVRDGARRPYDVHVSVEGSLTALPYPGPENTGLDALRELPPWD